MEKKLHRNKTQLFSSMYDSVFSGLMPAGKKGANKFLFIAGSGRNGSTLLSAILNNHPEICIPPEHRIIPTAIKYWYTHPLHSWEQKIKFVCKFLEQPSQWLIDVKTVQKKLLDISPAQRSLTLVLEIIYSCFLFTDGKQPNVLGDKTPSNTTYIRLIKKQFPSSKIIFLVRDPRDVMASYLKANEQYYTERFDFMVWTWKNAMDKYYSLVKKFPEDVLLIKYENLVTNPGENLNAIIKLLALDFTPNLLNDYGKNATFLGVKDVRHHQNIHNPISTTSIGAWKHSLPEQLAQRIAKKLAGSLKGLDYSF